LARITYFLAWLVALAAVALRLFHRQIGVHPRNLVLASGLLFLTCIASAMYPVACKTEEPAKGAAAGK
jgi:hypothetical protein